MDIPKYKSWLEKIEKARLEGEKELADLSRKCLDPPVLERLDGEYRVPIPKTYTADMDLVAECNRLQNQNECLQQMFHQEKKHNRGTTEQIKKLMDQITNDGFVTLHSQKEAKLIRDQYAQKDQEWIDGLYKCNHRLLHEKRVLQKQIEELKANLATTEALLIKTQNAWSRKQTEQAIEKERAVLTPTSIPVCPTIAELTNKIQEQSLLLDRYKVAFQATELNIQQLNHFGYLIGEELRTLEKHIPK